MYIYIQIERETERERERKRERERYIYIYIKPTVIPNYEGIQSSKETGGISRARSPRTMVPFLCSH